MNNTINGRTPDEIIRKMECWKRFYTKECKKGKYDIVEQIAQCHKCDLFNPGYSVSQMFLDMFEYVQQLERERDAARTIVREFAARINAGDDVSACEYCVKEFGKCSCNCLKDFELRCMLPEPPKEE